MTAQAEVQQPPPPPQPAASACRSNRSSNGSSNRRSNRSSNRSSNGTGPMSLHEGFQFQRAMVVPGTWSGCVGCLVSSARDWSKPW